MDVPLSEPMHIIPQFAEPNVQMFAMPKAMTAVGPPMVVLAKAGCKKRSGYPKVIPAKAGSVKQPPPVVFRVCQKSIIC